MTEFVAGMLPIIVFWTLPLAPMVYAAIASIFDTSTTPVRRGLRKSAAATELST